MAMARMCDRCGRFYIPEPRVMKEAGGRVNAIRLLDLRYTDGFADQNRKVYDLCPSCLHQLEMWLYGEEDQDGRDL